MTYRAVLFDLFDTLILFDPERLPALEVGGKTVRSTAGLLHAVLRPHAPGVSVAECYAALRASWQEAERQRALDHREVPASRRFEDFLRRVGVDPETAGESLVAALVDTHRRELGRAADVPLHHRALLRELGGRVRLAVVSNFDYTPTALDILQAAGVADLFEAVVVSDVVGWRKPHPAIFAHALDLLDVPAADALFVGDRADIDVVGAQRAGMHAVWVNRQAEPLPAGLPAPEYEVRDLGELSRIPGLA